MISFSQYNTSGYVFDALTKKPLEGVSVYYDGTTIGTITNEEGFFSLSSKNLITGNLVISYLGFSSKVFDAAKTGKLSAIYLEQNIQVLKEVTLLPDTWSRKKKLKIFKNEFLGNTKASKKCKIINEQAIRLYYYAKENTLYAYAEEPILIENSLLGYRIDYNLVDFEVAFTSRAITPIVKSVYNAGTVFFKEYASNEKQHKQRKKIYLGSYLHFMRSLSKTILIEEKFQIYKNSFPVDYKSQYEINSKEAYAKIKQKTKKLIILYDGEEQSTITVTKNPFYIDVFGNHSPARNIFFGGDMGKKRVADLLPLDYKP